MNDETATTTPPSTQSSLTSRPNPKQPLPHIVITSCPQLPCRTLSSMTLLHTPPTPHQVYMAAHHNNDLSAITPGSVKAKLMSFKQQSAAAAAVESKRPAASYVPEKMRFSSYQCFEGQMFVNWMLASLVANTSTGGGGQMLDATLQLAPVLAEFCTNLLVAGVMEQIVDPMAPLLEQFRVGRACRRHTAAGNANNTIILFGSRV